MQRDTVFTDYKPLILNNVEIVTLNTDCTSTPDPADELHARCLELIKTRPALLTTYLDTNVLQRAQPFLYRQCVESLREESLLWNDENHPALAAYVDQLLIAAYPEEFKGTRYRVQTKATRV